MSFSNRKAEFARAMYLLEAGSAREALQICESLLASSEESDRVSGYLCRGLVHESGGNDLDANVDMAIRDYRHLVLLAPDAVSYSALARAYMAKGDGGFAQAFVFLNEAKNCELTPEVMLGFALYHQLGPIKDYEKAKRYFRKAALHGRFQGFFGYSECARSLDQRVRAAAMDVLRVVSGPIIALLIGSKSRDRF